MKVLVVEDDTVTREGWAIILASNDLEVTACANASEAEAVLHQGFMPDRFLIDYALPVDNGLELIRWLRGQPAYAEVPIVLCTAADANKVAQLRCETASMKNIRIVRKPINTPALIAALRFNPDWRDEG